MKKEVFMIITILVIANCFSLDLPIFPFDEELILDSKSDWSSGYYLDGLSKKDERYMKINAFYELEPDVDALRYTANELHSRIIISEYDENKDHLKTTDMAVCVLLLKNPSTKYITISTYQYKKSDVVENNIQTLKQAFENDAQELKLEAVDRNNYLHQTPFCFSGELKGDDLQNLGTYQYGSYAAYGGSYTDSNSYSGETYILFEIDPKAVYYFGANDERSSLCLFHYTAEGKYLYYPGLPSAKNGGTLKIGDKFVDQARYVRPKYNVNQWSYSIASIANIGLKCYFGTKEEYFKVEHISIENFAFDDLSNYIEGAFTGTGHLCAEYKISAKYYLDLPNLQPRMVTTGTIELKGNINEFDSSGKSIKSFDYQNGRKFVPSENTTYISFTLVSTKSYSYKQFETAFLENPVKISLNKFFKYKHNTVMKDMTAKQWLETWNVGWNLGNQLESYYGTWDPTVYKYSFNEGTWNQPVITRQLIDYVHSLGVQSLRIPVTWQYNVYIGEDKKYHIHPDHLDRVQDIVDYAIEDGMSVTINMHFDAGQSDSKIKLENPDEAEMQDIYKYCEEVWTEIAEYFKDYDEYLSFESYNEVGSLNSAFTYTKLGNEQQNIINQIFVNAVRKTGGNNAKRILQVQPYGALNSASVLADFIIPEDTIKNKLILHVHNYPIFFDQNIETVLAPVVTYSQKHDNIPIIIGEYNTKTNYAISDFRDEAIGNFIARCLKHGIKVYVWDNGSDYGIINRSYLDKSRVDIMEAMSNPIPYKSTLITIINDLSEYYYANFDSEGNIDQTKSGVWITKGPKGYGLEIPIGVNFLKATTAFAPERSTKASSVYLRYINFYDESQKTLKKVTDTSGFIAIPEGAKYVAFGINSIRYSIAKLMYHKFDIEHQWNCHAVWIDSVFKSTMEKDTDGKYIDVIPKYVDVSENYEIFNADIISDYDKYWEAGDFNSSHLYFKTETTIRLKKLHFKI